MWHFTPNGVYTVGSGYKLATSIQMKRSGEAGQSREVSEESRKWKALWQIRIKGKIKMFLWKCNHRALPVRVELNQRKMQVDSICLLCGDEEETVEHLFFNYDRAKRIWAISPVTWDGIQRQSCYFKDWWATISEAHASTEGHSRLQLTAYLLWHIWKSRNEFSFNNQQVPEQKIIQRAMQEWQEYLQAEEDKKMQLPEPTGSN